MKNKIKMTTAITLLVFILSLITSVILSSTLQLSQQQALITISDEAYFHASSQIIEQIKTEPIETIEKISQQYAEEGYFIYIKTADEVLYDGLLAYAPLLDTLNTTYSEKAKEVQAYFKDSYAHFEKQIGDKSYSVYIYRAMHVSQQTLTYLEQTKTQNIYYIVISFLLTFVISCFVATVVSAPIKRLLKGMQIHPPQSIHFKTPIKEVDQLKGSYNQLVYQVNKETKAKQAYLKQTYHELRTPLTAISLILENTINEVWVLDKQRLAQLYEQTSRLHRLVEIRQSLDALKVSSFRLDQLIQDVYQLLAPTNTKNIKINLTLMPIKIEADKDKIAQVLINLLSNSIKFTQDRGRIDIDLKLVEQEVVLMIKDDGIGIKEADLPYIFNQDFTTKTDKGEGIGLYLAHKIIKAHQSDLMIFSKEGEGCEAMIIFNKAIHKNSI